MPPLPNLKKLGLWDGIFTITLILSCIGIVFIYSAEYSQQAHNHLYLKQILSLSLGIFIYILVSRIDYHTYASLSLWIYFGGIFLLILVLIFGVRIHGAKSWINLGFYNGQLAEFSKIAFIISFSAFFTKYQAQVGYKYFFLIAFLVMSPYLFLLILQPDFGTAVIFLFIFLVMFFVSGGNIGILLFCTPIFILSVLIPFLGFYIHSLSHHEWEFLNLSTKQMLSIGGVLGLVVMVFLVLHSFSQKRTSLSILLALAILSASFFGAAVFKSSLREYHYERILVTLKPDLDPERKGYNLNQSLISIGGGKFWGYGLTKGLQNRGNFLPANHTDFVLSVIGEEWGFIGVLFIIILNVLLIYQLMKIASETRDQFGLLMLVGIAGLLISHFLINVLSITGFLPIIGIPLPFLSYGGSFILSCFIGLGIVNNIRTSRFRFREFA